MKTKALLAALAVVIVPAAVFAASYYYDYATEITWAYTISNGKASVESGGSSPAVSQSTAGAIAIPSRLDGYSVTSIGRWAFNYCRGLTSVTIPGSVTSIGDNAFSGCSGLTGMTIPDGVTNIGNYAFSWCSGLTGITIPGSVTSIGNYAFNACAGLTSVTIPGSVTNIGNSAFSGCSGLTSITIPGSVTNIGNSAFSGCSGLTSITIPDGVTSIGSSAFSGCSGLTSVTIPGSVTSIGNYAFNACTGLTSVAIPDGVTSIGSSAFSGCSGLTSVTIPDGVTSIGSSAFSGCSELTSVTIPASVTNIGDSAFSGCSGLTSVTIPDGVTSIGGDAFYRCRGLTSVTIPDGVTSIGSCAFYGCSGLTSVTIPDSVTNIGYYAFRSCALSFDGGPDCSIEDDVLSSCWITYPVLYEDSWNRYLRSKGTAPVTCEIRSSQVRENDPTILDVRYFVGKSGVAGAPIKIRALAFKDGERNFWKVVRPETFVDGTAANIGDNVAANVEHTLSWKISADWDIDLATAKFEILTSEQGQLPLDWTKVPGANGWPDIEFSTNSQTDNDVLNAMFWYYASAENDLVIVDGYLKTVDGSTLVNRDRIGDKFNCVRYVADKMGLEIFGGTAFHYAVAARRKNFSTAWDSMCRKGMLNVASNVYVGDKAYCVIDVSGGTAATSYPITYLDSFPVAGWGDEYKTTKILLRRIEPGDVKMGDKKPVTLTQPFYIGVFEITQKQYQLVTGSDPSAYKGDKRPVEKVSWNDIRGDSSTYNWPNVTTVDSSSFIGVMQAKTGLDFDLPTESQWEYACRAGTTSYYNNGGSADNDLKTLGRYSGNRKDGRDGYSEHTAVGSYAPNAWGLYDMHGNVFEWCLDLYGNINFDPATDWPGASSGSYRVYRGGDSYSSSSACRSSYRYDSSPSYRNDCGGFRLSGTLSE